MKESNASALSMWIKDAQSKPTGIITEKRVPDQLIAPMFLVLSAALSFSSAPQPPVRHVPAAAGTAARGMIADVRMELHERDTSGTSPDIMKHATSFAEKFGRESKTALDKVTVEAMKLWSQPRRTASLRDLAETAWEDHLLPEPSPLQARHHDLACWEDRLLPKTSGLLPHTQPERLDLQRMYRQSSPPTSVRVPRRAPTSLGGWEERLLPSRRGENAARTVRDLSDSRWEDRLLP